MDPQPYDGPSRILEPTGRDRDSAAVGHGIAGIEHQVHQHLLELGAVAAHGSTRRIEAEDQPVLRAEQRPEHGCFILHDGVQIEPLGLNRMGPRECEELLSQCPAASNRIAERCHVLFTVRRQAQSVQQQLR